MKAKKTTLGKMLSSMKHDNHYELHPSGDHLHIHSSTDQHLTIYEVNGQMLVIRRRGEDVVFLTREG